MILRDRPKDPIFAPLRAPRVSGAWLVLAGFAMFLVTGCASNPVKPPPPPPGPPLSSLTVTPKTDTLNTGQNLALTATALDTLGVLIGNAALTWISSNAAVATVSSVGLVHASSEGMVTIKVSGGGQSDSATVAVIVQRGWYLQPSNTTSDLSGVFFLPDRRTGWAVGAGGRIITTSNAGANWTMQTSRTGFDLNAVWFTASQEGWAVGAAGTVMHTVNGGVTWSSVISNASETLLDVWFASRDTGWVVGATGVILRTFDRGANWSRQTPTSFDLQSVSFSGSRHGWAVGNSGVILGTHDRGLSWFIVQPSITGQAVRAVWRLSESQAWTAGQAGIVPRSIVGPDSTMWELDNAGASNDLQGVCYVSGAIGYAAGFNGGGVGIVLRTDDGGLTWQSQTPGTTYRLKDVFFADSQNGWVVGRNGTIVHTSSGGLP